MRLKGSLAGLRHAAIRWLDAVWYGKARGGWWLRPLALVFRTAVMLRRLAYRLGLYSVTRLPVPVVVVGNLTVGGTGKTPLTIALVQLLRAAGYRPAVVCRGYGARGVGVPQRVHAHSDPATVGDEPVLIARRADCPVVVGRRRAVAAAWLLSRMPECDVLVCDDGLQHYALGRDLEIVVVDGLRGFGNGRLLPAGPLREPPARLARTDLVVQHGGEPASGRYRMRLQGAVAVNLCCGTSRPLSEFADTVVHAVAGIGNPESFFGHLRAHGLRIEAHPFPDHHPFRKEHLSFADDAPVLMTEKDAVKCKTFAAAHWWEVPVEAELDPALGAALLARLDRLLGATRRPEAAVANCTESRKPKAGSASASRSL